MIATEPDSWDHINEVKKYKNFAGCMLIWIMLISKIKIYHRSFYCHLLVLLRYSFWSSVDFWSLWILKINGRSLSEWKQTLKYSELSKFVVAGCILRLFASIEIKMNINIYLFLNSLMAFWKSQNLKQYLWIFLFVSHFNLFVLIFCS